MTAQKYSASMDEDTLSRARARAEEEGMSLSAWLADAARDRLRLRGLRRQIEEYERTFGEITEGELTKIRREITPARPVRRRSRAG